MNRGKLLRVSREHEIMRFQFMHERSACAPTTGGPACFLGRAHLKPRRASSSLVLVTIYQRNRAISFLHCVCMRVVVHSSTLHSCTCTGARTRTHTRRRRRRFARSSPTTATTTVNEIVGSVSANYHAVPGVRGAFLRSYLPSYVVTHKRGSEWPRKERDYSELKVAHRSKLSKPF